MAPRTSSGIFIDDDGDPIGSSPAVLFIHSAAGSTRHFAGQLAHLRPHRRAVALDLRGHGRSAPPPDGDYSIEALAADVESVADQLRLDRFVLVGHSLGGAVAAELAGRRPERVAALLLLDPASDARGMPEEQKAGLLASIRGDDWLAALEAHWSSMLAPSTDAVRHELLEGLRATRREAVVGPLEALLSHDAITPLLRYRGPALSLITPLNLVPTAYHALVPHLPHRLAEGAGHWLHLDRPSLVDQAIDELLAGLPPPATANPVG